MQHSKNLKTQGRLVEVSQPTLIDRVSTPDLVFPEQVYLTTVAIERNSKSSNLVEIFGVVPSNYVGKEVELVESYHKLPNQRLFVQELYVEGQRVINQAVLKKKSER